MLRDYYVLAKPGIIYGNLVAALAGFFYGTGFGFPPTLALAMLVGLGFVIGSACVFNNYLDRDMDAAMERTKDRALATGRIPLWAALTYGAVLGVLGVLVLSTGTTVGATSAALAGFTIYLACYTPLKRVSPHATLVGALAGAMPIVVGYAAATGSLDREALVLYLILVLWQMPHFYAISLYRLEEYRSAGVPLMPIVRDVRSTVLLMRMYAALFAVAAFMPALMGRTGVVYPVVALSVSAWWISVAWADASDHHRWGRQMFRVSLLVLVIVSCDLALATVLP